jgi:hypothetical protein
MAGKVLFITVAELKKKSMIDGNVDPDKLIQFVEVAQDTHIQNYLGTNLYRALQSKIGDGSIDDVANADYKLLWLDYVKPMLVWFSQSSYLPFAMFQIQNGGVFKHRPENSDAIDTKEMSMLLSKVTETAEFYTRRFVDYICDNYSKFPEYNTIANNSDMHPDNDVNFHSWFLG